MHRFNLRLALRGIAVVMIAATSLLATNVAPASAKPSGPGPTQLVAGKGLAGDRIIGYITPQAGTMAPGAPTYCEVSAPSGIFVTDRNSIFTLFKTDCFYLDDGQPSQDVSFITMETSILLGGAPYSATSTCTEFSPVVLCQAEAGFPGPAGTYRGFTRVRVYFGWQYIEGSFFTIAQVSI